MPAYFSFSRPESRESPELQKRLQRLRFLPHLIGIAAVLSGPVGAWPLLPVLLLLRYPAFCLASWQCEALAKPGKTPLLPRLLCPRRPFSGCLLFGFETMMLAGLSWTLGTGQKAPALFLAMAFLLGRLPAALGTLAGSLRLSPVSKIKNSMGRPNSEQG